jgi:non-ribosomal peptide synthase protein (TIGR01720 family)
VADLTPSVARLLSPEQVPGLEKLVLAGEAVHLSDIELWWNKVQVMHAYGPSECTTLSTINHDATNPAQATHIGKGAGLLTWVVDTENYDCLLPLGCVGELLLEGPLVGPGYLNDADKTSQAFINDPDWLIQGRIPNWMRRGGRLYRTGDLVRYNEDGSLTFVGRSDDQVKIRGQRVELGEVSHRVQEILPNVKQAAAELVILRDSSSPQLAVFLEVGDHDDINSATHALAMPSIFPVTPEVEAWLAEHLPSYMVPTIFFSIMRLPSTPTGKIDHRRLRDLGTSFSAEELANEQAAIRGPKRQPGSDIERVLQLILARVLNIDPLTIGMDDSFFQLGGDSITAMQFSSAARAKSLNIGTTDVLRKKTISALVRSPEINKSLVPQPPPSLPQGHPESDTESPLLLSPMQRLYVLLQPDLTKCFDQYFFLRIHRYVSDHDLRNALSILVRRHAILRARFRQDTDGTWQQYISPDILSSFSLTSTTTSSTLEISDVAANCRNSLNIEQGPLVAAALFSGDGLQTRLFITIHHLVIDLVSWRVLLDELEKLLAVGAVTTSPSLDFSSWVTMQAEYAATHLVASTSNISLIDPPPVDFWGMQNMTNLYGDTTEYSFTLDESISSLIFGQSNNAFTTRPNELLLAALCYSFTVAFPNRSVPAIFIEGHGREVWEETIDISNTIGWFTTLFPIQIRSKGRGLLDTIKQTKDSMRSMPHNGWSYFTSRFSDETNSRKYVHDFPVEMTFNYSGLYQQLERRGAMFEQEPLPNGSDPTSHLQVHRFSLIETNIQVQNGRIVASIVFDKAMGHQDNIKAWIEEYQAVLVRMAETLVNTPHDWTLGDFPLAFTSYSHIDEFRESWLDQLHITLNDIEDIFPCSPVQEGMLLARSRDHTLYQPWSLIEVRAHAQEVPLNVDRLVQAWSVVVLRHSLLRAIFIDRFPGSDRVMQVILKNPNPAIRILRPEDEKLIRTQSNAHSPAYGEYELRHCLTICVVDTTRAYLRFEADHAIIDGYSRNLLWDDFRAAYIASSDELSIESGSYRDFVQYLEEKPLDVGLQFWSKHLANVEPCAFPGSEFVTNDNSATVVNVRGIDSAAVQAFCRDWETTAASVIQTAWALVLGKFTRTATPCFGTLSSGRDVPVSNVDRIIGPVITVVPCRVDLESSRNVPETIRQIQEDYIASLPHQHTPLAAINRALGYGSSTFFNSIVSFQKIMEVVGKEQNGFIIQDLDGIDPTEVRMLI